jgi:hypothetical protein
MAIPQRAKTGLQDRRPQRSPDRFGLWATWTPEHGESIETFDIVTTAASRLVAEMHDRMPVIVAPADYQLWPTASWLWMLFTRSLIGVIVSGNGKETAPSVHERADAELLLPISVA